MKRQFLKNKKWKWKGGILIMLVLLIGVLLFQLLGLNNSTKGIEAGTEIQNESIEAAEEIAGGTEESTEASVLEEKVNKESTTDLITDNNIEKDSVATVAEIEINYVPIAAGWKVEDSAKGDITSSQKADLDAVITSWKAGELSDLELKTMIMNYLDKQGIDYTEVSVTSEGYALYDEIPEIDLRNGGNLYSYVGTYSTGEQNPDGTEKTVCYNWSAFVF